MALNLGYTAEQKRDYRALCVGHHRRIITMQLLDLNHNYLAQLSNRFIDGQVDIDADAEVTRKLTTTIFDPKSELGLDNLNVNDGSLYVDRMIRVVYGVASPDGSRLYEVPIFCGPISKLNRKGPFLSVEASGKEYLLYGSMWHKTTYKKGRLRSDVIRDMFLDHGEQPSRFNVPKANYKVAKDLSIGTVVSPWSQIEVQAKAMSREGFYDGRGVGQVRANSSTSQYTFSKFTVQPEITYNTDVMVNSVIVIGWKPRGRKTPMVRRFVPPSTHPLSPYKLGRIVNGKVKPRYYTQEISDSGLTSLVQINRVGKKALADGLLKSVEAAFEAPVIPDLEENDTYTLDWEDTTTNAKFRKSSIPLVGPPVASVGYLRRVNPAASKIRRNAK